MLPHHSNVRVPCSINVFGNRHLWTDRQFPERPVGQLRVLTVRVQNWLVPFAAATGVSLHYDAQAQQDLGIDKTRIDISNTISDIGLYGSIGGAAALFDRVCEAQRSSCRDGAFGRRSDREHVAAGKGCDESRAPHEGNGSGGFWPHGTRSYETDGSFSSGHAIPTFAFARVIASNVSEHAVQLGAYAFALAVGQSTRREPREGALRRGYDRGFHYRPLRLLH